MKIQITITTDIALLTKIWSSEWAEQHAGKTYDATLDKSGWAEIDGAKFPPEAYSMTGAKTTNQQTNQMKTTIEQSNQAVARSLAASDGHNTVPHFAVGQIVNLYGGYTTGTIESITSKTAIVEINAKYSKRVSLENLRVQWSKSPYQSHSELDWIESLLRAQKRPYRTGIENAIRAN